MNTRIDNTITKGDKLPKGWEWSKLGDISAKPQYGWTTKANHDTGRLKLLRTTDITSGSVVWSSVPFCTEEPEDIEKYLVESGDILISRAGSVGVSFLINKPERAVFASYLIRFRPKQGINTKYFYYYLKSPAYWEAIGASKSGIAVPNVNASKLALVPIPLAPLTQQKQIVAEIEKQFSRLDEAVANLKRIKANLKRYKAAVLKSAVEGKLTEGWRNAHPDVELAAKLLNHILTERRTKWSGKGKYKEPAFPDTTGLSKIPEGWVWSTVESLSTKVVDGVHKKPNYVSNGVPFVTVRNLTAGPGINLTNLNFITREDHEQFIKRANPEEGDILISKDGTLGVVRVIKIKTTFSIFVSVALIKPVLKEMSNYLGWALSAPQVQAQMVPKGSGLQHIHLEDLRADCIPIPHLDEQKEVVAEVERRLSVIDELETTVETNLTRAARLRQAILNLSFTGKLF